MSAAGAYMRGEKSTHEGAPHVCGALTQRGREALPLRERLAYMALNPKPCPLPPPLPPAPPSGSSAANLRRHTGRAYCVKGKPLRLVLPRLPHLVPRGGGGNRGAPGHNTETVSVHAGSRTASGRECTIDTWEEDRSLHYCGLITQEDSSLQYKDSALLTRGKRTH